MHLNLLQFIPNNDWRDRHVRTTYSPGMTNELNIALEPKGAH
jgi:hypothetical protein